MSYPKKYDRRSPAMRNGAKGISLFILKECLCDFFLKYLSTNSKHTENTAPIQKPKIIADAP